MKTIYKYRLATTDSQTITMPIGSEILTVRTRHGDPCLWALVETEDELEKRTILTFGTGHPIPSDIAVGYLGTYQLLGGDLVFHVFVRIEI